MARHEGPAQGGMSMRGEASAAKLDIKIAIKSPRGELNAGNSDMATGKDATLSERFVGKGEGTLMKGEQKKRGCFVKLPTGFHMRASPPFRRGAKWYECGTRVVVRAASGKLGTTTKR